MAGLFDNFNKTMGNIGLAGNLGLLSTGVGLLEGQPIGKAVQSGLGAYQGLNQIDEQRKRKGLIDKLVTEGGFTKQEQALIMASQNPASVAAQIRNANLSRQEAARARAASAGKPSALQQKANFAIKSGFAAGTPEYNRIVFGNALDTAPEKTVYDKRRQAGIAQGLTGDDLSTFILTGNLASDEKSFTNLTAQEISDLDLPAGTLAQRDDLTGKVTVVSKAEKPSAAKPSQLEQRYNFITKIQPSLSKEDALAMARTSAGGTTVNVNRDVQIKGDYVVMKDPDSATGLKFVPIPGSPAYARLEKASAASDQVSSAEQARSDSSSDSGMLVLDEIRRAKDLIKESPLLTTGFIGDWTKGIGGTPAANLSQLLSPIQANIGFDRLGRMREESPTGGALGQVAVKELEFLQAVKGSIEQLQGDEQLTENLTRIEDNYLGSMRRIYNAALADQKAGIKNKRTGRTVSPSDYFSKSEIDIITGVENRAEVTSEPISESGLSLPEIKKMTIKELAVLPTDDINSLSEAALDEFIRRMEVGE